MNEWKEVWYDWAGNNDKLFLTINHVRQNEYDVAMQYISWFGERAHFLHYMMGLFVIAALLTLFRVVMGKKQTWAYISSWIGVFVVMFAGWQVEGHMTRNLKEYFSYPRPYIAYASGTEMYKMEEIDRAKDFESFPSGHVAFTTLLVVALWPILGDITAMCGVALVFLMGWSRVSLGVHFPADVLGAVIFTVPVIVLLRRILYFLLRKLAHIRC